MMKKLFIAALAVISINAQAANLRLNDPVYHIPGLNNLNWKVGDYTNYDVTSSFGNLGTMEKSATAVEGNGVWVKSELNAIGQKQLTEMLVDQSDGKILKYRENGQEKPVPTGGNLEVISEEGDTVTVPAGTFETIHIKAKQDGKDFQVWVNPSQVPLDGTIQAIIDTGMFPVTLKLTKYGRK